MSRVVRPGRSRGTTPCTERSERSRVDRRQFLRSGALTGGALAVGGMLDACGQGSSRPGGASAPPPPANGAPKGVLKVPIVSAPTGLEAATLIGPAGYIAGNLFDNVLRWNKDYTRIEGSLVASWEESADGLEYVLHMRPGAKYHDGEPVDAPSLATNYKYLAAGNGFSALLIPRFRKLDSSDPTKLRVVLDQPAPDFVRNQTFMRLSSPKSIAAGSAAMNRHPVGSGPFKFVQRTGDGGVTLEAFGDYWGVGPYLERVEFPVIGDLTAQASALQAGEVDVVVSLLPAQVQQIQANSNLKVAEAPAWSDTYLVFVIDNPPFDDIRVRQAAMYALNRPELIRGALLGHASPSNSIYPPSVPDAVTPDITYPYSPSKARELLREAGHPNGVSTELLVASFNADIAQAVAGQLGACGINVRVRALEQTAFNAELANPKSKYPLTLNPYFWATGGPIIYQLPGLIPGGSHYHGKDLPALQQKLLATPDGPAREQLLREVEDAYARHALFAPLWVDHALTGLNARVQGYSPPKDEVFTLFGQAFLA